MSVESNCDNQVIDERRSGITRLIFNPFARWSVPVAALEFHSPKSSISFNVCEKKRCRFDGTSKETFSDVIALQRITKVRKYSTINLRRAKIECRECLSKETSVKNSFLCSSYLIDSQCVNKITTSFIAQIIARNIQCRQCLWIVRIIADNQRWSRHCLTWLVSKASGTDWTPV